MAEPQIPRWANFILGGLSGQYGTPNFVAKLGLASMAGSVGAVLGNQAKIALIRMTADGQMPPEKRRNYKNIFEAILRIIREEGPLTLFRGVEATVTRSAVVNAAQLGGYAQAREMLLPSMGEGIGLHFASAMISGFITTIVFLPVDIVKTRVQNASVPTRQVKVLFKIIKNEGPLKLWSGFAPTYTRLGPQTVLLFLFLEQLVGLYLKFNKPPPPPDKGKK